ncbi:MAG: COG1470 family protein [Planctomycetota bacterium]
MNPNNSPVRRGLPVACAALAFAASASLAGEAAGETQLSKDELRNQLETRQAQMALDRAKSEMDRAEIEFGEAQGLFKDKIYTKDKLNQARQVYDKAVLDFRQAELELEKTRLDFLKDATLVTVLDAKKYRGKDGQVMASVTLRNDSDLRKARVVMREDETGEEEMREDERTAELKALLKVDNVIVTLNSSTSGAIIGDPFQRIVPELRFGQEVELEYLMLKPAEEAVKISVEFLDSKRDYTVFLRKEALQDLPTIDSTQYAQQGELGSKIRYDLELERLAKTEQSFALVVLNLPPEFTFAFLDPASGARITQVKFTDRVSKQNLNFEVSVPEKLGQRFIDASITFHIVVTRQAEQKTIYALKRRHEGRDVPAEEIAKLKGNATELILIPSGTGKLDVLVGNLFKEVKLGGPVRLKFNIMNSGTLSLRRVAPDLELPVDWEGDVTPKEVEVFPPGEKIAFTADVRPPEGTTVGEYTVTIKCEGHAGIETIEAEDKDFTVRIAPKASVGMTAVLVIVLVGLVLAIAVASVKISRR